MENYSKMSLNQFPSNVSLNYTVIDSNSPISINDNVWIVKYLSMIILDSVSNNQLNNSSNSNYPLLSTGNSSSTIIIFDLY